VRLGLAFYRWRGEEEEAARRCSTVGRPLMAAAASVVEGGEEKGPGRRGVRGGALMHARWGCGAARGGRGGGTTRGSRRRWGRTARPWGRPLEVGDEPDRWAPPVGGCERERERGARGFGPRGPEVYWPAGGRAGPRGWVGFVFFLFLFFQILFQTNFKPF
jgi:hypothetical protein